MRCESIIIMFCCTRRLIFHILCQIIHVISQNLQLTDVSYQVFSIPNGGFLSVCTKSGGCKDNDWVPVCYDANSNARTVLKTTVCQKFGYDDGKVFMSAQSVCFLVSCPTPNSYLSSCDGYTTNTAQTMAYVVCYSSKCLDVAEPINGGNSVNCDFENGDSCGWILQNFHVESGVDPDHTVGSRSAHYLTTPNYCSANTVMYSTAVSSVTVGCDDCEQYFCFTYYAMNTGDQPTVVISAVYSPTENQTLFTKNTPFNQAYTPYFVHVEVKRSFRIAVTTWCSDNRKSFLYLDDFTLTAGKCPNEGQGVCYNGAAMNSNGDRCQCPDASSGRACELSFCNKSSTCNCPQKINWIIVGGIIGGTVLILLVIIITICLVRKCKSTR